MLMLIKSNSHIEYDIWMSHLIDNFNFFDEVIDTLLGHTFPAEPFDCYGGSHPLRLEDFAISTSS